MKDLILLYDPSITIETDTFNYFIAGRILCTFNTTKEIGTGD
jgi:hypothetical protein